MRFRVFAAALIAVVLLIPASGFAHQERHTDSPPRPGKVPDPTRTPTEVIDVCKTGECPFSDIQAGINAAHDGALIRVWPGLYNEEPSRAVGDLPPDTSDGTYSYEFQRTHPNVVNLIAIVGKHDITVRGMGRSNRDVVIDTAFRKHVGLRGDRADGLVLQNFSFYHAFEHGVYVLDSDGYVIDNVYSAYSQEYP